LIAQSWKDDEYKIPTAAERFPEGLVGVIVNALAIDPKSPMTVYAGAGGAVYKSSNGGANWSILYAALTKIKEVHSLAIDPQSPTTVYVGSDLGVYKSSNGGDSWSALDTGLTNIVVGALAIDPQTPTTVYAGTWGGSVLKLVTGDIPPERATLISPSGTISTSTPI
jgi:photosystem II stability/assembly factor-like uncharacterized protein